MSALAIWECDDFHTYGAEAAAEPEDPPLEVRRRAELRAMRVFRVGPFKPTQRQPPLTDGEMKFLDWMASAMVQRFLAT